MLSRSWGSQQTAQRSALLELALSAFLDFFYIRETKLDRIGAAIDRHLYFQECFGLVDAFDSSFEGNKRAGQNPNRVTQSKASSGWLLFENSRSSSNSDQQSFRTASTRRGSFGGEDLLTKHSLLRLGKLLPAGLRHRIVLKYDFRGDSDLYMLRHRPKNITGRSH